MRLTRRERIVLFSPLVALLATFLIVPALLGLVATVTNYGPLQSHPDWVGLRNFTAVVADRTFGAAVRNLIVFTLAAVPLELAIGFGLAYAMRRPFRGRAAVRVVLLIPWLISPVASGVMWRFLLGSETGFLSYAARSVGLPGVTSPASQHGLALATVVLVETWRVAPLVAFLLLPALSAIPADRWGNALIDGLSTLTTVRHVAMPAIRSLVAAVSVLLIGGALATFDSIVTLTGGGPGTETTTPALYGYDKAFTFGAWPAGAATGWLIGGAVLVVGAIYVRVTRDDA